MAYHLLPYLLKIVIYFIIENGVYVWRTATRAVQLVKVKVEVKFTLEQATKAHRGSRGIALLFL